MDIVRAADVPAEGLRTYVVAAWGADFVVAHGERVRPLELPGFVAMDGDRIVGHLAYRIGHDGCELVAIAAQPPQAGIGSRLLERVVDTAREEGCARVWLTTTNDNLDALRFYQRRGFHLCGLRAGAVDEARQTLKPELPPTGAYEIPMRDELDLELHL